MASKKESSEDRQEGPSQSFKGGPLPQDTVVHLMKSGTEFLAAYAVLQEAQAAAVRFARAGVSCEDIDAAARNVLVAAGLGDLFIHRTGHGIGLETHEDPYIVAGNDLVVESGMAFSIEPGFYLEGRFGARIEDIVIATDDGVLVANTRPRHLVVIP